MADHPKRLSRVLTDLHHGGRAVESPDADPAAVAEAGDASTLAEVIRDASPPPLEDISTPFGYLFVDLQDALPGRAPADRTAPSAVVVGPQGARGGDGRRPPDVEDPGDPAVNSTIPPIYTYWGQFIDHDLTANTDRDTGPRHHRRPADPELPERGASAPCATCASPRSTSTPSTATVRSRRSPRTRCPTTASGSSSARSPCGAPGAQSHPATTSPATCRGDPGGADRRLAQRREPDRRPVARGVPAVPQRGRRLGGGQRTARADERRLRARPRAHALALPVVWSCTTSCARSR